jgi:hypothetical protein
MAIVYQHRRKDNNEIFYIGIGLTDKRAYHIKYRGKFWKDYTSKYQYEVEITHQNIIWEEACVIEKYLISFYGRRDLGLGTLVNMTDGGDGLINPSIEIRNSIGEKHKNKKISQKHKDILSTKNAGKNNPFYGKKHSKKTIEIIKRANIGENNHKSMLGKKHTEDSKNKMSKIKLGKKMSNETKLKISISNIGRISPMKGKLAHNRKSVMDIDSQKIFNSVKDAADYYNKSIPTIIKYCKIKKGIQYI